MKRVGIDTAAELARRAGKPTATITNILRSSKEDPSYAPRLDTLESIAKPLGVTAKYLQHGNDTPRAEPQLVRDPEEHTPADDEVPLEGALVRAMPLVPRATMRDFDTTRTAARATYNSMHPDADLEALAVDLLRAARDLREAGLPTTPGDINARVASGKTLRGAEVLRETSARATAEADEEARRHGVEPGVGRAELERRLAKRNKSA